MKEFEKTIKCEKKQNDEVNRSGRKIQENRRENTFRLKEKQRQCRVC